MPRTDAVKGLGFFLGAALLGLVGFQAAVIGMAALLAAILLLVIWRMPAGLPAGRIAEQLGVPSATLSFHLKELKSAGVATCRREGRSLIYGPDFAVMNALLAFLMENCCENGSSC